MKIIRALGKLFGFGSSLKKKRKMFTSKRCVDLVCEEYKKEAKEATNALVLAFEKKQTAS